MKKQPRALLVYLAEPFRLPESHPAFDRHQALRQCKQIAGLLGEFDFVVDVADINAPWLHTRYQYDLILSHRLSLPRINRWRHSQTRIWYLASGMNHRVLNQKIRERLERIRATRGCEIGDCQPNSEDMPLLAQAHALIGFGTHTAVDTWKQNFSGPVYCFDNYAVKYPKCAARNYIEARSSFLFFGSTNQVNKGLDLLLDVFAKHPEWHLFVAGPYEKEKDFVRCYRRELFHTSNIHPVGWVAVRSPAWGQLATRCAFAVLPSCSEGQPGSVLQCMQAGMIPIVTAETGIETGDFGFTLEDDKLATIERMLSTVSCLSPEELLGRSARTEEVVSERYSETAFLARWRDILRALL